MRESIVPSDDTSGFRVFPRAIAGILLRIARNTLVSRLSRLERGMIIIDEGGDRLACGKESDRGNICSTMFVHDPSFYTDVFLGGSVGAGESYMAGCWTSDDLTQLIRIIIMNRNVFNELDRGMARVSAPANRLLHYLRSNTKEGSRKNIAAHYDLGNDFYSLFLDDTMTYSCGIFASPEYSLQDASIEKYDRICRKLQLTSRDHVLEIGGGWGGFAIHAAKNYGCRVTTTTISGEQYAYTKKRIQWEKLDDRVELVGKDYRDLKGKYDKLVSIEMIEAVGHQYLETFFSCCSRRLTEDGVMLLQAITIDDRAYESHIRSVDFIKRYIFPGSCIPSMTAISRAVENATDMRIAQIEDITPHYATTLRMWRERFFERIEDVRNLGYTESFIKMWEYYLCYCEAGFAERYLGDVQILLRKPGAKSDLHSLS